MYPSFERVKQANWDVPDLFTWFDRLEQVLQLQHLPWRSIFVGSTNDP